MLAAGIFVFPDADRRQPLPPPRQGRGRIQHRWDQKIERGRKAGLPKPEPIHYPDDIILDPDTGECRIRGPQAKEQKQRLKETLIRRDEAQREVNDFADKHRRARDPRLKQSDLEEWHWEQRMFDILNDVVGPRYKATLENRSWAKGASREGKTLEELKLNRALRSEYVS